MCAGGETGRRSVSSNRRPSGMQVRTLPGAPGEFARSVVWYGASREGWCGLSRRGELRRLRPNRAEAPRHHGTRLPSGRDAVAIGSGRGDNTGLRLSLGAREQRDYWNSTGVPGLGWRYRIDIAGSSPGRPWITHAALARRKSACCRAGRRRFNSAMLHQSNSAAVAEKDWRLAEA